MADQSRTEAQIAFRCSKELKVALQGYADNSDRALASECERRLRRSLNAKLLIEDAFAVKFGFKVDITEEVADQIFRDLYAAVSPLFQAAWSGGSFAKVARDALQGSVKTIAKAKRI